MFSAVCVPRRRHWTSDTLLKPNSMQINAKTKIHWDAGEVGPGAASPHRSINVCVKEKLEAWTVFENILSRVLHGSSQTLPVRRMIQGRRSSLFPAQDTSHSRRFGISHFASNPFSEGRIYRTLMFSCNRKSRRELLEHREHLPCLGVACVKNELHKDPACSLQHVL